MTDNRKVYAGKRTPGGVEVRVRIRGEGGEGEPLTHHVHHSPDGFEWGYGGSGPSELARCMLWDYLGREPEPALYQDFKFKVIATLRTDEWIMGGSVLEKFVERHGTSLGR